MEEYYNHTDERSDGCGTWGESLKTQINYLYTNQLLFLRRLIKKIFWEEILGVYTCGLIKAAFYVFWCIILKIPLARELNLSLQGRDVDIVDREGFILSYFFMYFILFLIYVCTFLSLYLRGKEKEMYPKKEKTRNITTPFG